MFSWDDMRYVLHVAKTGSYSAAAKELKVNHTTVARRVSTLERNAEVKLFTHTSKGFVLTEAGQDILSDLEFLHETTNRIARKLQGKNKSLVGTVNITMPHDIYRYFLSVAISQLKIDYPDMILNISLSNSVHNISIRESDLAVRFTVSPPEDLVGQKVASLDHAIYGNKNSMKNHNNSVGIIVWTDELEIPEWAIESFKCCHIVLRVDDLEGMHAAVKSGLGVALMPCYLPKILADSDILHISNYDLVTPQWGLWVLNHVDVRASKKVQVVRKYLIDSLNKHSSYFERK